MSNKHTQVPIGIAHVSCGNCYLEPTLCEKCLVSTLKANGLSAELAFEVRGLKQRDRPHVSYRSTEFSELHEGLRKLISKANP